MPAARTVVAWVVDVIVVAVFVLVGRRSHGEDLIGFVTTFLPFFAGMQTGWLLRGGAAASAPLRSGLPIWGATVVLGLVLRVLTGDTAAPSFVVVTTVLLGILLIGWRATVVAVRRLRSRASRSASTAASD